MGNEKYLKSKDAIELSLDSYLQGYRDACAVLLATSESMNKDDLRKRFYDRLVKQNLEVADDT